ncbi:ribosome recycling factor [soil metagenome]
MAYDFLVFTPNADKTLAHIRDDINTLRTGRASAQLLDIVDVEAYGTRMKVNELANVSVPDPTLIVISPWDKSILGTLEKAIATSPLNLHPVVDGQIIRISVPALTEERRKEMVKFLKQKIESGRVMMRNVRSEARKEIESLKDESGVSEDDIKADLEQLDIEVKKYMDLIEKLEEDKAKDLMKV